MKDVLAISRMNMVMIEAHVADVRDDQMAVRPDGAPAPPAWHIGHLTSVRGSFARKLAPSAVYSREWHALFGRGTKPTTDANIYPTKAELLTTLEELNEQLLVVIASLGDDVLDAPSPADGLRRFAPTLRETLAIIFTTHDGYHLGQMGAWRAAMKLPAIL